MLYGDDMDARARSQIFTAAKTVAMTIAGLTMAVTPLAVWASPTLTAFYWVLTACAVASGVVLLLSQFEEDAPPPKGQRRERAELPPELTRLLQGQRELAREDLPELRRFVQNKVRDRRNPPDR